MGVRGIVVASLPGKDLRDFRASERRQRASLHPSQPFGVLVLDGTVRRPIPTPIASLLERIAGREVSLLVDPPALVFEATDDELPASRPRLGPRPIGPQRRRGGPARRSGGPAPLRARRAAGGRAGRDRRSRAGRGPHRRPRAHRLTRGLGYPRLDALDLVHRTRRGDDRRRGDPRARRPARGRRAAGRPAVPGRRPRRGQDPVREGLRRRPRDRGHRQLPDVRADDRVRRAAADVPRRPVPARRRRRRARGRPARRAPAGRRRARGVGRAARVRAARARASTSSSTAPATSRAGSRSAPATRATGGTSRPRRDRRRPAARRGHGDDHGGDRARDARWRAARVALVGRGLSPRRGAAGPGRGAAGRGRGRARGAGRPRRRHRPGGVHGAPGGHRDREGPRVRARAAGGRRPDRGGAPRGRGSASRSARVRPTSSSSSRRARRIAC